MVPFRQVSFIIILYGTSYVSIVPHVVEITACKGGTEDPESGYTISKTCDCTPTTIYLT